MNINDVAGIIASVRFSRLDRICVQNGRLVTRDARCVRILIFCICPSSPYYMGIGHWPKHMPFLKFKDAYIQIWPNCQIGAVLKPVIGRDVNPAFRRENLNIVGLTN